jgi:hypothetical protein
MLPFCRLKRSIGKSSRFSARSFTFLEDLDRGRGSITHCQVSGQSIPGTDWVSNKSVREYFWGSILFTSFISLQFQRRSLVPIGLHIMRTPELSERTVGASLRLPILGAASRNVGLLI